LTYITSSVPSVHFTMFIAKQNFKNWLEIGVEKDNTKSKA